MSHLLKTLNEKSLLLCILFLNSAFVNAAGLARAESTLDLLIEFLAGSFAKKLAVVIAIGLGYAWWVNKISWGWVVGFIGGSVLIFGATEFADYFAA